MSKVAVIGAGYWGKNLVRTFHQMGVLECVCDLNPHILKKTQEKYPDLKLLNDYQDVFSDSTIDCVVIATPAVTHFDLVTQSLNAGKHVFIEKPLALNVEEGEKLVALAKQKSKTLMVGHILQYHNAIIKLKELIDQGELGKIQYIYSNRLNIGKIRSEENILWSFAPHDISVILMFLNEMPENVYTTGESYLQKGIYDVTMTNLKFPSGVKAHIFVSWIHPFKEQKLVVVGDKKMAVFDDVSTEKLFLYPHKVEWIDRHPVASKGEAEVVSFKTEEPLMNECKHFIECIEKHNQPKTDGDEGLEVLRVLQYSQESLNTSKAIEVSSRMHANDKSYFVHASSYIDEDVTIGAGTQIWHYSHILSHSTIGKNCKIGQNVVIGPDASIGHNCKIQNNVSVYKGVTLEDDVFCGPSMVFTNVNNPRCAIPRMDEIMTTLVKKGASIGANATIVCGHLLGRYCFIGAGAVVTKDVPDYALVIGNPGRIVGWMCECGEKLDLEKNDHAQCNNCQRSYQLKANLVNEIKQLTHKK